MSWNDYHKSVLATVGSNEYVIPTGSLRLANEPVSRSGSLAVSLFNSRVIQSIDGWLVRAQFTWPHLGQAVDDRIRLFIEDILADGVCTIDFDPEEEFEDPRTVDFVLESAPDAVVADFVGRARHRPAAFNLVSRRQFADPIEWIVQ